MKFNDSFFPRPGFFYVNKKFFFSRIHCKNPFVILNYYFLCDTIYLQSVIPLFVKMSHLSKGKLYFEFKMCKRTYKGNYTFAEFIPNCLNYLQHFYAFLPKDMLMSRARQMWQKKMKETIERENETESPLAKKVREQKKRKLPTKSKKSPGDVNNNKRQNKLTIERMDTDNAPSSSYVQQQPKTPYGPNVKVMISKPVKLDYRLNDITSVSNINRPTQLTTMIERVDTEDDQEEASNNDGINSTPDKASSFYVQQTKTSYGPNVKVMISKPVKLDYRLDD